MRRRKALVARLLDSKGLLLSGVAPDDLVDDEALAADDERWEGLDEGADADYAEALEAYVMVCADALELASFRIDYVAEVRAFNANVIDLPLSIPIDRCPYLVVLFPEACICNNETFPLHPP